VTGLPADQAAAPGVLLVADDLIWATRLAGQLRTIGARPTRIGSLELLTARLEQGPASHVIVDLTARSYDGIAAVEAATAAGARVLCVGQHDDPDLRRRARAAGAERALSYRTLFEAGHATLAGWLGVPVPAPASLAVPEPGPERLPR
jgi:DNA-binding NarL/FixJ family response regulator